MTTNPAAAPVGYHNMGEPWVAMSPAVPRQAAAEVNSELIAAPFHQGGTPLAATGTPDTRRGRAAPAMTPSTRTNAIPVSTATFISPAAPPV